MSCAVRRVSSGHMHKERTRMVMQWEKGLLLCSLVFVLSLLKFLLVLIEFVTTYRNISKTWLLSVFVINFTLLNWMK